ncbi:hypothetical protein AWB76_05171 [Caballeronia temeraria]|uniref:DUF3396 domain-containing protein n=1 Tax=Caballeronia temeraria TaxID=1777137 RepID=A0A158C691_9BURK|nr:type VI immunity family protein [Caballeronia temeraria]SAK77874.1 hypothetical protein AWB76_05171 [Caballeronia temeraria]
MADSFASIDPIKRATADVAPCLAFVVFIRGRLAAHAEALRTLLNKLQAGWLDQRLTRYRAAAQIEWQDVENVRTPSFIASLCETWPCEGGTHYLQLASDVQQTSQANVWEFVDVAPVPDTDRASHLFVRFADGTPPGVLSELTAWLIDALPLSWATGGYVFEHRSGAVFTAHMRMAALAKRCWAVQIIDRTSLQWDAMRGMPGANWLTLIGRDYARAMKLDLASIENADGALAAQKIFRRAGRHALAIAAGPKPLLGDINAYEDFDTYVHVARLIAPLLLDDPTPLAGPFARPDVLGAWLRRFEEQEEWLACDIGVGG